MTRWWAHTAVVVCAVVVFMAASAYAAWPWWEFAFFSDGSPVSWLSGALLVANAAVALSLTLSRSLRPVLGTILTTALATLALDEEFQVHERVKDSAGATWGNLVTLLVGAGGVVMLAMLARTIRSRPARNLIASGVVVGIFALWVDLGEPPPAVSRLEEAYEVVAESLFLCGLLELSRPQVQSAS